METSDLRILWATGDENVCFGVMVDSGMVFMGER